MAARKLHRPVKSKLEAAIERAHQAGLRVNNLFETAEGWRASLTDGFRFFPFGDGGTAREAVAASLAIALRLGHRHVRRVAPVQAGEERAESAPAEEGGEHPAEPSSSSTGEQAQARPALTLAHTR
ncbi:hypothetical protein [Labrys monachus]|uniref:Uncharacterized protein n=1 Tax=Labrys monachus TaxID=217067 RepID=A0ABU0F6Q2_9HYPH|nr:hypothetical protein [Labrys monachus]MDQ0390298.1 hypothetical protein [Labrys monachus]